MCDEVADRRGGEHSSWEVVCGLATPRNHCNCVTYAGTDVEVVRAMRICITSLALLAACTGSINSSGAGGDDDGTTPPPPPPAATVQVTVQDGTAPQAGIDVLFQNSDGSVVSETTTNAMGQASGTMTAGNVTIVRTFPPSTTGTSRDPEIYTYVGVAAGDNLVLGDATDDTGVPGAINVTVPTGAQGTVKVVSACGSGQGTAPTVPMTVAACPSSVKFFVEDGNQNAFVATAPYSPNVDLSTDTLDGTLATTFTSSNVTTDITSLNVESEVIDGTYVLYSSGNKRIDQTPQTVNLPNLQNVDELIVSTISSANGTQIISSRQPYAVTPVTIDATANLLPYVSTPTYSSTGITWTETGTGTPNFTVSTLSITPKNSVAKYTRYIIAPYTSMTLALPTLAGNDTTYNPGTMDSIQGTVGLGSITGGYAAARAFAFSTPSVVNGAPMNGTTTLSYAGNTAPAL